MAGEIGEFIDKGKIKDSLVDVSGVSGFFIKPAESKTGACEIVSSASGIKHYPGAVVTFPDKSTHKADVIRMDEKSDLAILRVKSVENADSRCKPLKIAGEQSNIGDNFVVVTHPTGGWNFQSGEHVGMAVETKDPESQANAEAVLMDKQRYVVAGHVGQADRGAPVMNQKGEVAGMVGWPGRGMPEYHVVMSSDLKRNIAFKNKFDAPALFSTVRDSKFTVYVDVLEKGKTKKYQGSGFFVYKESGKEGFCEGTTAYHVVGDAQKVHVVLNNGKSYDASVVAGDSLKDLAVLRVKGMQPGSCRVLPLAEGMSLRPSAPLLELTARDFEMRYRTGTAAGYVMHPVLAKGSWLELKMDGTTYDGDSGSAIISKRGAVVGIHHSTAVLSHVGYSTPAFYLRQMLSKLHPGKI